MIDPVKSNEPTNSSTEKSSDDRNVGRVDPPSVDDFMEAFCILAENLGQHHNEKIGKVVAQTRAYQADQRKRNAEKSAD